MNNLRMWLATIVVLLSPLTLRAETSPVGIVADISGQVEAVQVVRGQQSFTPEIGFLVFNGDRITVTAPGTAVTVNLVEQAGQVIINKDNTAELGPIAINTKQTTLVDNILLWLADSLPRNHKAHLIMMATRGQAPAIVVPVFRSGNQAVITGTRDWPVTWQGGAAPYELCLIETKNSVALVQKTNLSQPSAILEGMNPAPGSYVLEVRGNGRKAIQSLVVVAKSALPPMPIEIQHLETTDKFRKFLYLTWLAGQDHGKWVFEAMLETSQLSKTYPPAERLLRSLQENVVPTN